MVRGGTLGSLPSFSAGMHLAGSWIGLMCATMVSELMLCWNFKGFNLLGILFKKKKAKPQLPYYVHAVCSSWVISSNQYLISLPSANLAFCLPLLPFSSLSLRNSGISFLTQSQIPAVEGQRGILVSRKWLFS